MTFVVDASVVGCWCFSDENNNVAEMTHERLTWEEAFVPALWWFEVRNVLVVNERRGRIDPVGTAEFLAELEKLPIRIDRTPNSEAALSLARRHRLTVYDAAYLELARRLSCSLATLDARLAAAARADGLAILEKD